MSAENVTCDLCEDPAFEINVRVFKEGTDESKTVNFCKEHWDKLERYNNGEDVDWGL